MSKNNINYLQSKIEAVAVATATITATTATAATQKQTETFLIPNGSKIYGNVTTGT